MLIFDTFEEAEACIANDHEGFGYNVQPLRPVAVLQNVESEYPNTPNMVFYASYTTDAGLRGTPVSPGEFRAALEADGLL